MIITFKLKKIPILLISILTLCIIIIGIKLTSISKNDSISEVNTLLQNEDNNQSSPSVQETDDNKNDINKKYIKWVDFNIPYSLMDKALTADIKSQNSTAKLNWIEILSYLSAKCGGNFKSYKSKDFDTLVARLNQGETIQEITKNQKNYNYYIEAYTAVLKEFVGTYKIQVKNKDTQAVEWQTKYGLKVFSPIAKGYNFFHYDDFGNQRSYGYSRKHFGNDLMGSVGTPIVAIESGTVEAMGWNIYGGWRVGIRSFDKKRYYYYAHLNKDHPYHKDLYEGRTVKAGEVIGYLGMTGYSTKENVSNIKIPHLHVGLQLIFDESQKEGVNQIWIDFYNIIELLQKNKSQVYKDTITKDFNRVYDIDDQSISE